VKEKCESSSRDARSLEHQVDSLRGELANLEGRLAKSQSDWRSVGLSKHNSASARGTRTRQRLRPRRARGDSRGAREGEGRGRRAGTPRSRRSRTTPRDGRGARSAAQTVFAETNALRQHSRRRLAPTRVGEERVRATTSDRIANLEAQIAVNSTSSRRSPRSAPRPALWRIRAARNCVEPVNARANCRARPPSASRASRPESRRRLPSSRRWRSSTPTHARSPKRAPTNFVARNERESEPRSLDVRTHREPRRRGRDEKRRSSRRLGARAANSTARVATSALELASLVTRHADLERSLERRTSSAGSRSAKHGARAQRGDDHGRELRPSLPFLHSELGDLPCEEQTRTSEDADAPHRVARERARLGAEDLHVRSAARSRN